MSNLLRLPSGNYVDAKEIAGIRRETFEVSAFTREVFVILRSGEKVLANTLHEDEMVDYVDGLAMEIFEVTQ